MEVLASVSNVRFDSPSFSLVLVSEDNGRFRVRAGSAGSANCDMEVVLGAVLGTTRPGDRVDIKY